MAALFASSPNLRLGRVSIDRGDSILVFPELKGKTLQIAKDITQIMYQIAVSVGVLLAIV